MRVARSFLQGSKRSCPPADEGKAVCAAARRAATAAVCGAVIAAVTLTGVARGEPAARKRPSAPTALAVSSVS